MTTNSDQEPKVITDKEIADMLAYLKAEENLLNSIDTLTEARQRWSDASGKLDTLNTIVKVGEAVKALHEVVNEMNYIHSD